MSTHSASARGVSASRSGTGLLAATRLFAAGLAMLAVPLALPRAAGAQTTVDVVTTFATVPPYRVTGPLVRDADGTLYGAGAAGGAQNRGGIFRIDANSVLTSLHDFSGPDGEAPSGGLVRGADAALYGTTSAGGAHGTGTIFRIETDGAFVTLHSFAAIDPATGLAPEGTTPRAQLLATPGGRLYGVTESGGSAAPGGGVIFSITTDGQFAVEHEFSAAAFRPRASLTLGSDGALYGTVSAGGTDALGGVFRFVPGAGLTMLHAFANAGGTFPDGYDVRGPLAESVDGALYGTTLSGGQHQFGTVFRVAFDGTWSIVHSFAAADPNTGVTPEGFYAVNGLVSAGDGNLHGVASQGGSNRHGVLYRVEPTGAFSVQRALLEEGGGVVGPLMSGDDGRLYGASQVDGPAQNGTVFAYDPASATTQIVHAFIVTGPGQMLAALARGDDGQMYGLGYDGGGNASGVIFRLSPTGQVTLLHLLSGPDGANPYAPLTKGPDGAFYGTTTSGGQGNGTVFRISPDGAFAVLHAFAEADSSGAQIEGAHPYGSVAVAPDGTLFGIASDGGAYGAGTIFSIANGVFRVRHAFGADESAALLPIGWFPQGGMGWGPDGRLYGSTSSGPDQAPFGSLFAFDPVTGAVTALAALSEETGFGIWNAPTLADDGRLYFAATDAGPGGAGTVLRYDPAAAELKVLYGFTGGADGAQPYAPPVQGADGALYGTASGGGTSGYGTLYRLALDGTPTTLHTFDLTGPGGLPLAGLLELQPGVFYGSTGYGQTGSAVFRATVPIAEQENRPPVAHNASLAVTEDTPLNGALTATDDDGDALTFTIVNDAAKGSVALDAATGAYSYVPAANATGADSFTFRARDGVADSNIATVTVAIAPVNDQPVANARTLDVVEDTPLGGTLSGTDADGDPLTYSLVTAPGKGSVQIVNAQTGAFLYTPASNATGGDTFTFRVRDGSSFSAPATVTVTIAAVNDAPVAADASATTSGDVAAGTVKAVDVDSPTLTYALVANGSKGAAVIDPASGAFRYTAVPGASGTDRFTYRASDGSLSSNVAAVTIVIPGGNAPPVASNGSLTTKEDRAAFGWLHAVDPERKRLAYRIVTHPSRGRVVLLNKRTGQYLYVPHHDANGADAFSFAASDGSSSSNVAQVRVSILPVNDRPSARGGWITTRRNTPVSWRITAWDADHDRLGFAVRHAPRHGAVKMNAATGALVYTPRKGFTGVDELTVRVSDGAGAYDLATVRIMVRR